MKKQIAIIHGGDTFNKYKDYIKYLKNKEVTIDYIKNIDWKSNIEKDLNYKFEIIAPKMPCKQNARYYEWKIWFEKFIPFIKNNVIFIGHSLGGIFIAKYLAENNFPRKIKAIHLVAAPFNEEGRNTAYSLVDFQLHKSLKKFEKQSEKIFVYHSKDDPIVPFKNSKKYLLALPKAQMITLKNKGHISQKKFPELVGNIKNNL